jgi:hypothetical protein
LPTISTSIQVNNAPHPDVHYTQETLVLLLEFLLVKDLHGENALFRDFPGRLSAYPFGGSRGVGVIDGGRAYMSKLSFQYGFKVFLMTPVVLVCSPLMVATANGSGNPKRCTISMRSPRTLDLATVSRTEDIPFVQPICGNDCDTPH